MGKNPALDGRRIDAARTHIRRHSSLRHPLRTNFLLSPPSPVHPRSNHHGQGLPPYPRHTHPPTIPPSSGDCHRCAGQSSLLLDMSPVKQATPPLPPSAPPTFSQATAMAKASQASARRHLTARCAGVGNVSSSALQLRSAHVSCQTNNPKLFPTAQALYIDPYTLGAVFDHGPADSCPPATPRPGVAPGFDDPERCCGRAPLVPSRTHLNGTKSAVARPCWGVVEGGNGRRAETGNGTSGSAVGVSKGKRAVSLRAERWTCWEEERTSSGDMSLL